MLISTNKENQIIIEYILVQLLYPLQSQQGNVVLYKCLISLDKKQLQATDGTKINAIKSMPVVARIVYEKETYLD
ncbi:MAG: hypothetical protein ACLUVC_05100 [Longibaculum sp.]